MRVDFYELSGRFQDPLDVAAVLVGKAWPELADIVLVAPRGALAELDDRLWRKPAGRFLPHGIDDETAPIRLVERAPDEAALLINLDPAAPLPQGRYDRVLELVPADEESRPRLRQRWKDWKAAGAELHHHVLN
ncbi:MAG: DNA polymerase III subunit chi [Wenzhouxiangella sp.]|jgi:DNA polymerase-3 subunit chi|nr:DNA polymerase III subunit chi [Wenzhouxiangella sp.]